MKHMMCCLCVDHQFRGTQKEKEDCALEVKVQATTSMSSMPPSAAFAINIDGMTISPSSWATDPQFQGQESFSGGTAFLNETGGNVVARGFGAFFSIVVMIVVYFDTMFSKNATITGEQF